MKVLIISFSVCSPVFASVLAVTQEGEMLGVHAQGSVSPLSMETVYQQAYGKASNAEASDLFGASVAVAGNRVVVGATGESSAAVGVNGDQFDNSLPGSGAVYVFDGEGSTWMQESYIKASNPGLYDGFGYSVGVHRNIIAVGAPYEDSAATGIDGDQSSDSELSSGAVYLFEWDGVGWVQTAYLKASNAEADDQFGYSVTVWDGVVAVGAPRERSGSAGVGSDQQSNALPHAGAVYIFAKYGAGWTQEAYIKPSDPQHLGRFGSSLSLYQNRLVVGAEGHNGGAGAAYLFERNNNSWSEDAKIEPTVADAGDEFGSSVSVWGDYCAVGAPGEDSGIGVLGQPTNNSRRQSGAAYVFQHSSSGWSQEAFLKASNAEHSDGFGSSLKLTSLTLIVGAINEDSTAVGLGGIQADNGMSNSGAGYLFRREAGSWRQEAYIKASNAGSSDQFGYAIGGFGKEFVVASRWESSDATGIDGDQLNDNAQAAGAVYVFDEATGQLGENYCGPAALNSSLQRAEMSALGSRWALDNELELFAEGLPSRQFGYFLCSQTSDLVPNPGGSQGILCLVGGAIGRFNRVGEVGFSGASGEISLELEFTDWPVGAPMPTVEPGSTWNFQAWYRDVFPQSTSNFSDAISVTFQ